MPARQRLSAGLATRPVHASAPLTVRSPLPDAPKLAALRMPPPLALKTDVVKLLAEERGER